MKKIEVLLAYIEEYSIDVMRTRQLCAQNYSDDKFSILAHGRTAFHLLTLEATYIKTSKPSLCKQKEFVYSLKISH